MATGEQQSSLKTKKGSSSSSRARNDSDAQWLLIPNNLELGARAKPSKKQRNKEKSRDFQQENLSPSSEVTESLSCKPRSSFRSFPRDKSNTSSWIKDQYMNEEKSKRIDYESDGECTDSDYPHFHQQNVHFPVIQDVEQQEHQIPPMRGSGENENVKSVKDEIFKKEAAMVYAGLGRIQDLVSEAYRDRDLSDDKMKNTFIKLQTVIKDIAGWREKELFHHSGTENEYANVSPSSSTSRISNSKESIAKDAKMAAKLYAGLSRIQDLISEAYRERGWSNDLQNALKDITCWREKDLFHYSGIENEYAVDASPLSASRISNSKESIVNRDTSGNAILCDEDEQEKCNHQEMKTSDDKIESISSDEYYAIPPDIGQRMAAVKWQRQQLKNKMVAMMEHKKMNDDLIRDRVYQKETASAASEDTQPKKAKGKKKKFCKLSSLSPQIKEAKGPPLEDNQNMTVDSADAPISQLGLRNSRTISLKRDNVKKEQNSSFPARRHYEAEGRANEDPDIPAAPPPVASPVLDNPETEGKIRKLKVVHQHLKVIKDIVVSILETRKSESEEGGVVEKDLPSTMHFNSSEPTSTILKEVCDGIKSSFLDVDSDNPEETEVVTDNLETTVGKKDDLTKFHSHIQHLMQMFPTSDSKNDDPVRSSGEGAYTLKKISRNVPETVQKTHSLRMFPHQDNLQLTRQNIVTMEAHNQNSNSNIHNRDCNSVKKDNINNLSGKMGKISIQNSMNSSFPDVVAASNNNVDSMSTFSYELNQNNNLPNENELKTILDILRRDKRQHKSKRVADSKIFRVSSSDSEPQEGSNSALAIDSSALAAWGGSSTQENFEDDNERAESIDQDDDQDLSPFDKSSAHGHRFTSQYSGPFSNMQQYIDSLANVPDKSQRNFHEPVYNRIQNQPISQSRCTHQNQPVSQSRCTHQNAPEKTKSTRQPISPNATAKLSRDIDTSGCGNNSVEYCHQEHISPKFLQQLKHHLEELRSIMDSLNDLCQNELCHERSQPIVNSHSSQNCNHVPNTWIQNQPMQSGYQHASEKIKASRQPLSSNATARFPKPIHDDCAACAPSSVEHCHHQHLPSKFIKDLKSHIEQFNALCQNQLYHERVQPGTNSHSIQDCNHMPNPSTPVQLPSDGSFPYNQQLLLCLNQCYHALHMQQLEIHHLQRCIWQNTDGENLQQQNSLNSQIHHDDTSMNVQNLQMYSTAFNPPSHFIPEQVSPFSPAGCFHLPVKQYPNYSNSCTHVNSTAQPSRAVIHPTSQNNTVTQETLNNQVPPRTRANNFWDNFRSYSRQNLLSTANNAKRNENSTPVITPQVRQVFPFMPNESPSHTMNSTICCGSSTFSDNRTNTNIEDTAIKNTKHNGPVSSTSGVKKKEVLSNISSRNIKFKCRRPHVEKVSIPQHPNLSVLNSVQLPSSSQENLNEEEVPRPNSIAAATEREKVGTITIHRMASEKECLDYDDTQAKVTKDQLVPTGECERKAEPVVNPLFSDLNLAAVEAVFGTEIKHTDKTNNHQLLPDTPPTSIQNLPTAAIPPLSKHGVPRTVSTGAIRKQPKVVVTVLDTFASSQDSSRSTVDSCDPQTSGLSNKTIEDIPTFITERVSFDIASMLPSLKRRLLRDGCSQRIWRFINDSLIESLTAHLSSCNIVLSKKSMLHLRQSVYIFISLFSEVPLTDMDVDFVKYVEQFIYENMACFTASGQFAPLPTFFNEENFSLEMEEERIQELNGKLSNEPVEPVSLKMPIRVREETGEVTAVNKITTRMRDEPVEAVNNNQIVRMQENLSETTALNKISCKIKEDTVDSASIKMTAKNQEECVEAAIISLSANQKCSLPEELEEFVIKTPPVPSDENSNLAPENGEIIFNYENFIFENVIPEVPQNLEAEIEQPEVEIGTEADLAEADQSQGANGIHHCCDASLDQKAGLDDIPTKLCASEDELSPQLKEEHPGRASDDGVSDDEFVTENGSDWEPS